jgi:hypothetical protein
MSGRGRQILSRFPAHLEADRPGKHLGVVVEALARDLDVLAAEMAAVRRAHRLSDAGELADLLRLAALHGLGSAEMSVLFDRFRIARERLAELADALDGDDETRDAAAEALLALWGLAAPAPRLAAFAPLPDEGGDGNGNGAGEPDPAAAARRLAETAGERLAYRAQLAAVRARVAETARLHAVGNGTVRGLLEATANLLDLELVPATLVHSSDRFWHAALARDRLRLAPPGGAELPAADELLGMEENPLSRQVTDRVGRRHGELFRVLRRGFDRVLLQVRLTGRENRTVGPLVVNRDEGRGVGFAGAVEDGQTLVFTEEGRALLDGSDVTSFAYSFAGACFAGDDASAGKDFVFDGPDLPETARSRAAVFAVATPAGALDPQATFPHAGDPVEVPGLEVGETRFAFFVQQAHASAVEIPVEAEGGGGGPGPRVRRVPPRPAVGFFDGSVFAAGGEEPQVAAEVELSWLEHEAYAVRVLIPPRFQAFDTGELPLVERVAAALARFQPAGVEVRVEPIDDRWVLGGGTLGGSGEPELILRLRSGTTLWETPPEG